jgi:thiol-disulfide isomerase/thioredoxin
MHALIFIMALMVSLSASGEKVDFTLKDLDGKPVTLSDFRGKWVIVNYWATWCPPCLEEIPDLVDLYEDNRDTIMVLGIAFEEVNKDYLREFVSSHMISYPVMNTEPVPVTELGPVTGLPTSYIISPEGERVARQEGPVTREAIEKYIARKQRVDVTMQPVTQAPGAVDRSVR